jgi:hypothetical protein
MWGRWSKKYLASRRICSQNNACCLAVMLHQKVSNPKPFKPERERERERESE